MHALSKNSNEKSTLIKGRNTAYPLLRIPQLLLGVLVLEWKGVCYIADLHLRALQEREVKTDMSPIPSPKYSWKTTKFFGPEERDVVSPFDSSDPTGTNKGIELDSESI
jgi:hypothetical protein